MLMLFSGKFLTVYTNCLITADLCRNTILDGTRGYSKFRRI